MGWRMIPQTQLAQVQIEGEKTDHRKLQRHRGSPRGRTRAVHEINDGQKSVYNMQNVDCLLLRESYIYYLVEMIVGCTHKPPEEASRYHMGAQGATGSHAQTSRWRPAQWKMTKTRCCGGDKEKDSSVENAKDATA